MPKISIIVLNYNDYKTTYDYINTIKDYKIIDRIIVVDNCSTDDSYVMMCNSFSAWNVSVIQTPTNGGYARGNNFGLHYLADKKIDCDYVIVSNPDIIVDEVTIKRLVETIESKEKCFAVTGEIYTVSNKRIAGFRSKLPSLCQLFLESSVVLRKVASAVLNYGRQYKNDQCDREGDLYKAESLPGCFFLASFDKFQKIGFFDEQTFLYSEEDILFFKAKNSDYRSFVVPGTKIVHAEGSTIKKNLSSWITREKIRECSNLVYMNTCLESPKWICSMYRLWNRVFIFGRFLNMRFRTKYY